MRQIMRLPDLDLPTLVCCGVVFVVVGKFWGHIDEGPFCVSPAKYMTHSTHVE